jgi:hypothetical protein
MMQGKLKLTKGHMPTIVKYVQASKELVESTARVPTKFRDEDDTSGAPPRRGQTL